VVAHQLADLRARARDLDDLAERALTGPLSKDETARLAGLAELAGSVVDGWRYQPAPA
jgi:hypothetical protein